MLFPRLHEQGEQSVDEGSATDVVRWDVVKANRLSFTTDLAAAVSGGIGLAASGNIDATGTNPSMFEPVHGSAPDIAGKGIADPTAAVMSVALLLNHIGQDGAAARVDRAVAEHLASRGDGTYSTAEVGERIRARL
jgi:3-isopropylmalate dehydrogenase